MQLPVNRFFTGFGFIFAGKSLANEIPGIKKWIRIPFAIDLCILLTGLYFGIGGVEWLVKYALHLMFSGADSFTAKVLYYPFWVIFFVGFLGFFIFTIYLVASLIAAPFYAILSEKVMAHYGQYKAEEIQFSSLIKNSGRMLFVSLKRTALLLCIGVCLLILSFVPIINLIATYSAFILLAFDASDYAMETKQMSLRERLGFLRTNLPEYMGMGAFVALTSLLPGLILLIMPYAVIGSSKLIANREGTHVTKANSPSNSKQL